MARIPEEDIYVYDIEVDGTDIHETYVYDEHVEAERVKQDWLNDLAEKHEFGEQLAERYKEHVKVTDLWMKHNSERQADREATPIPPQGLPGETVAEAEERRLSSKDDTEQK